MDEPAPRRVIEATVDRVEAEVAVLDADGTEVRVPRAWLPGEPREGMGVRVSIEAAPDVERALKARIEQKLRSLAGKG